MILYSLLIFAINYCIITIIKINIIIHNFNRIHCNYCYLAIRVNITITTIITIIALYIIIINNSLEDCYQNY